jgi:hypothetical protein
VAHSYLAKSDLDKLIIDGDKDMLKIFKFEWNSLLLIIVSNSFLRTGFCIILLYNLMPFNMPPSPSADNPGDVYLNNYFERRQRQYKDNPDALEALKLLKTVHSQVIGTYGKGEKNFLNSSMKTLIIVSNSFLRTGFCIILLYNLMPFNMPPSPSADNPDEPSTIAH